MTFAGVKVDPPPSACRSRGDDSPKTSRFTSKILDLLSQPLASRILGLDTFGADHLVVNKQSRLVCWQSTQQVRPGVYSSLGESQTASSHLAEDRASKPTESIGPYVLGDGCPFTLGGPSGPLCWETTIWLPESDMFCVCLPTIFGCKPSCPLPPCCFAFVLCVCVCVAWVF